MKVLYSLCRSFHITEPIDLTDWFGCVMLLCRWSAYVEDGKVKAVNVEEAPSDFKVTGAEVILGQI